MIASDDELDARLRLLFADDRLDGLQARADAGETIVAGARRRRNRRKTVTAAGGAAMAVVLVVGGVTFGKIQERDTQAALSTADTSAAAQASASSQTASGGTGGTGNSAPVQPVPGSAAAASTSSSSKPPVSSPAKQDGPQKVLTGPLLSKSGLGNLTLGMTEAQLTAAGITFQKESDVAACAFGKVTKVSAQSGDIRIYLSDKYGVAAILPMSSHTPEGVGTNSTVDDVKAIYPHAQSSTKLSVSLGSTSYEFVLSGSTVKSLILKSNSQDCGI